VSINPINARSHCPSSISVAINCGSNYNFSGGRCIKKPTKPPSTPPPDPPKDPCDGKPNSSWAGAGRASSSVTPNYGGTATPGGELGTMETDFDAKLDCKKVCVGGKTKYQLRGQARPKGFKMQVYTKASYPSFKIYNPARRRMELVSCKTISVPKNIRSETIRHEKIHEKFSVDTLNKMNNNNKWGKSFDSVSQCKSARDSLAQDFSDLWEEHAAAPHSKTHKGKPRRGISCNPVLGAGGSIIGTTTIVKDGTF